MERSHDHEPRSRGRTVRPALLIGALCVIGAWIGLRLLDDRNASHVELIPGATQETHVAVIDPLSPPTTPTEPVAKRSVADAPVHAAPRIAKAPANYTLVDPQSDALLEAVVTNASNYAHLRFELKPVARDGSRGSASLERLARDGRAYFAGLRSGEYTLSAFGKPRDGGQADSLSRIIRLHAGEHREEIVDLAVQFGELEIHLREPVEYQGGAAFASVRIESPPRYRVEASESDRIRAVFDFSSDNGGYGSVRHSSTGTLSLRVGTTFVTVLPHGTRYRVDIVPGATTVLDESLPPLARRRVQFWDADRDAPYRGSISARLDGPVIGRGRSIELFGADVPEDTGALDRWWPAVPFSITTRKPCKWVDETQREWTNGMALVEDLRVQFHDVVDEPTEEEMIELLRFQNPQLCEY